jgi:hypothetical protein
MRPFFDLFFHLKMLFVSKIPYHEMKCGLQ